MTRKEFEDWKEENRGDYSALVNLANDNGAEEAVDELISSDELDERVKTEAESGWERVAHFLSSIVNNMSYSWYRIDGYGNADLPDDWDTYADEVERQMEFDEYCCDVCGEDTDTLYSIEEWISEEEEENFSEELLKLLRDYDDDYDRCPKCWETLKKKAAIFLKNKDNFDKAQIEFTEYVDYKNCPEGVDESELNEEKEE